MTDCIECGQRLPNGATWKTCEGCEGYAKGYAQAEKNYREASTMNTFGDTLKAFRARMGNLGVDGEMVLFVDPGEFARLTFAIDQVFLWPMSEGRCEPEIIIPGQPELKIRPLPVPSWRAISSTEPADDLVRAGRCYSCGAYVGRKAAHDDKRCKLCQSGDSVFCSVCRTVHGADKVHPCE